MYVLFVYSGGICHYCHDFLIYAEGWDSLALEGYNFFSFVRRADQSFSNVQKGGPGFLNAVGEWFEYQGDLDHKMLGTPIQPKGPEFGECKEGTISLMR